MQMKDNTVCEPMNQRRAAAACRQYASLLIRVRTVSSSSSSNWCSRITGYGRM